MADSPLSLRRWGPPAVAALVAASGCDAILGLTEVSLDPGVGGGGHGGSTVTTTGTGGNGGSTTSTTGTGGDGGQMSPDFQLSIGVLDASVPLDGYAFLSVEIVPSGGFAGAVDVGAEGAHHPHGAREEVADDGHLRLCRHALAPGAVVTSAMITIIAKISGLSTPRS